MNATERETLIRLRDVPALKWLPRLRSGKKLSLATLHRWVQKGLKGRRLRTVQVGGSRCTCETWLLEFFAALGDGQDQPAGPAPARSPAERRRGLDQADRILNEAGI